MVGPRLQQRRAPCPGNAAEEWEARIGLGRVFVEILSESIRKSLVQRELQFESNQTAGVTHQSVFGENLQASAGTS